MANYENADIQYVIDVVRELGTLFLKDFKTNGIPADMKNFKSQFDALEETCKSKLQAALIKRFPAIQWPEDLELDMSKQLSAPDIEEFWLCDSMDGAVQYMQHLPGWTINLVLVKKGEPFWAIIFDPQANEMYWAIKGKGAFLNGKELQPASKTEPSLMLATFNHPPFSTKVEGLNQRVGRSVERLLNTFGAVRNYGPTSLQITGVASGRIDVFYEEGVDTFNWLAGILIAREAGAQVLNQEGRPWAWGNDSLLVAVPGLDTARFI